MTEAQVRQKPVSVMQGWVGCKESNESHKKIIDIYNAHKPLARGYKVKYTDSWCATAVSAAAIVAELTDIIPTECSCSKLMELFQKMGVWQENDAYRPSPGDYIFYDWQDTGVGDNKGNPDHVGMVEKVVGTTITVIEGNFLDSVGRRTIFVNARYIRGYGVPDYASKETKENSNSTITVKKSVAEIATEVLEGKWGNSPDRKTRLEAAGYDYREVQAAANQLNSAKIAYYPACNKRFTTINVVNLSRDNLFMECRKKF